VSLLVQLAEVPARPYQPGNVRSDAVAGQSRAAEPTVTKSEVFGGLGGVIGDVGGGPLGGQLSAKIAVDRLGVDLSTEAEDCGGRAVG
jgi:hypothetical protein